MNNDMLTIGLVVLTIMGFIKLLWEVFCKIFGVRHDWPA